MYIFIEFGIRLKYKELRDKWIAPILQESHICVENQNWCITVIGSALKISF